MPHMLAETCSNVINTQKYRASAHQGKWKLQCNKDFQEFLPSWVEYVELDYVAHTEQTAMQLPGHSWKTKKLHSQEIEYVSLLKSGTAQWWSCFLWVIFCIVQMHKRSMKQLSLLLYRSPSRNKALWPQPLRLCLEGKSGFGMGKNFTLNYTAWCVNIFWLKLKNKITIENRVLKATKWYIMTFVGQMLANKWVLILHNYLLSLNDITPCCGIAPAGVKK